MGKDQQPTAGPSKTDKKRSFRFSPAAKAFMKDYFQRTNKAPKKREREQMLAHLKGLGDTEVTDIRIINWFNHARQEQKRRPSLPFPTSAFDPTDNDTKWVDVRHETLWPSLTREALRDLEHLYVDHLARRERGDVSDLPYDHWAEGLDARPVHVRMWCKAQERQSKGKSRLDPVAMAEERSQLPTPGSSISPEPPADSTAWSPPSPGTVKVEPPVSPTVATTQFQPPPETPKQNTSMGLHEAIQVAFSSPPHLPLPTIQPTPTTGRNGHRKSSSIDSHRTLRVDPPPTQPLVPESNADMSARTSLPPTSTAPPQSEPPPSSPHPESPIPLPQEESDPEPSTQPKRDLASERAALVTEIAAKLDEVNAIFSSIHGQMQLAGSTQNIARRNEQFLNEVSAGRFTHLRLTSAHIPVGSSLPDYNPLRVLAEWRDDKRKGKERENAEEMEVD
ncbi:hypothetical protein BJ322DRAFT_1021790 [Thelephora terrestris]|uniref:Homeobox domain-containing protein n=1 Tax=Thelephora terrestris TaxID=56493 RepID=A0A9P6L5Z6_9AGAM|nr:hypothetical protein BJ322DRAFT_1021790 [Thelephora terrestris]